MTLKKRRDNFRKHLKSLGKVLFDGPYSIRVKLNKEQDAAEQYFAALNNGWDAIKVDSTLNVMFE